MPPRNNIEFHGENLRLARIFNGYTLSELGDIVSNSRQYIQRLEVDPSTFPSENLIEALAETLNVLPSFFFSPIKGEVREETCRFRKRKTTPLHVRNKALSCGTIFNSLVSKFDSLLDLPKYNFKSFNVSTIDDIERAAEKCRIHWGLHLDRPIHNVVRVIENAGGIITSFLDISEKIDAFSYLHKRPIVVRVLLKNSTSRTRFDLSHELGHLVLHQGIEDDDDSLEDQANQFASAFLLPRVAFIREFPKGNRINWEKLINFKKRWGASLQAIIYRAYSLGLLNATQYRNAHIYISRKGWRKDEPSENHIDFEPSVIIEKCFDIMESQGVTPLDIVTSLNLRLRVLSKYGYNFSEDRYLCRKQENNEKLIKLANYRNNIESL